MNALPAIALDKPAYLAGSPIIKVFALDDCEFWAGETLEDCVKAAQAIAGTDCYDDPEGYRELSPEEMKRFKFYSNDDTPDRSFEEELALQVATPGTVFPQFFASSEW